MINSKYSEVSHRGHLRPGETWTPPHHGSGYARSMARPAPSPWPECSAGRQPRVAWRPRAGATVVRRMLPHQGRPEAVGERQAVSALCTGAEVAKASRSLPRRWGLLRRPCHRPHWQSGALGAARWGPCERGSRHGPAGQAGAATATLSRHSISAPGLGPSAGLTDPGTLAPLRRASTRMRQQPRRGVGGIPRSSHSWPSRSSQWRTGVALEMTHEAGKSHLSHAARSKHCADTKLSRCRGGAPPG